MRFNALHPRLPISVLPRVAAMLAASAFAIALHSAAEAAEKLGAYPADASQVSVAGISSGAFMANQLHIAHSADIMGAAMIAGGLYGCAVDAVEDDGVVALASQAVGPCLKVPFLLDEPSDYKKLVDKLAAKRWIDAPANIAHAKIYLFTGSSDDVVDSETVAKGKALYSLLGVPDANVVFEDRTGPAAKAGHSWVTLSYGGANKAPYIDACAYDQAGAELKAIYGQDLKAPTSVAAGQVVPFDQKEFVPGKAAAANGLSDTGYLYVPPGCAAGAGNACRLHVVLHGCQQSAEILGDVFYKNIGVNEWADANNILVLYPQAQCDDALRIAAQPLGDGARQRQSRGVLELVGLQRRPAVPDEEGGSGDGFMEDDPAHRGKIRRRSDQPPEPRAMPRIRPS